MERKRKISRSWAATIENLRFYRLQYPEENNCNAEHETEDLKSHGAQNASKSLHEIEIKGQRGSIGYTPKLCDHAFTVYYYCIYIEYLTTARWLEK